MSRRPSPRPASTAFRAALQHAAPKTRLAAVQGVWEEIAGARLAAVARPTSEREGEVTIGCADPVWAEELDLMQEQILARLRDRLGMDSPLSLRFRAEADSD